MWSDILEFIFSIKMQAVKKKGNKIIVQKTLGMEFILIMPSETNFL